MDIHLTLFILSDIFVMNMKIQETDELLIIGNTVIDKKRTELQIVEMFKHQKKKFNEKRKRKVCRN